MYDEPAEVLSERSYYQLKPAAGVVVCHFYVLLLFCFLEV